MGHAGNHQSVGKRMRSDLSAGEINESSIAFWKSLLYDIQMKVIFHKFPIMKV